MKSTKRLTGVFALVALLSFHLSASAQQRPWNNAQAEVWRIVAQSWEDEQAANGRWPGDYLHPLALAWDASWPAPQDVASQEKWARARERVSETLAYELFPMAISVVGDAAAVHYSYVRISQMGDEGPERSVGYVTETLVRDGSAWKYLSLSGWDAPGED